MDQQEVQQSPQDNQQPVFAIEKVYVRDLSIEVPNAPEIFLEQGAPEVQVDLKTQGRGVADGVFETVLTVTVTAKLGDKTMFLVEAGQGGVFRIMNVPDEQIEGLLAVACPSVLFPYAREAVTDAITRAGFQPIILQPVNFEAMYLQRLQEAQAASGTVQ